MRLPELLRSHSFRLALLYTALFGLSIGVLLAVIYVLAGQYVKSHVDEFVSSELELFEADYGVDGAEGVLGLVRSRNQSDRNNHWIYLYQNGDGAYLAGDQLRWPGIQPGLDGFFTLPGRLHSGAVRAREAHFADGSRLLVGLNDYEVGEMRSALARAMGVGVGAMLLLAIGGGVLVTMASRRQIESINRVTHEIMAGDLRRRVPASSSRDEFGALGRNINAMLDRIGELMLAVRGITDNIAHDLRMPLARLRSLLERARDCDDIDEQPKVLSRCLDEVDSILATFGAMLRITNVESGILRDSFVDVDLSAIARDAEQLFEPMFVADNRKLIAHIDDAVSVRGNRDLLFQALANLLDNAVKFTPPGSIIQILLARHGDQAELCVADDGPGVPVELRERVFQRLFRGDPARSTPGSGLGLSLVRAVALLHDGICRIDDNRPGARVLLGLPLSRT